MERSNQQPNNKPLHITTSQTHRKEFKPESIPSESTTLEINECIKQGVIEIQTKDYSAAKPIKH